MANVNINKLEKDIAKNEEKILQKLKEELESMDTKEFEQYFNQLIDKYYNILFTYDNNYSRYRDNSKKEYDIIKNVKSLLSSKYNNLNNYEAHIRYDKAEDIAYNQMNQIHIMEDKYSNTIYYNAIQELKFITTTLSSLVASYKKNKSKDMLVVIESIFNEDLAVIIRDIKKLPVYDNLEDYKEKTTIRKEHLKDLSEKEKKELPEVIEGYKYTIPILSVSLPLVLDKFDSVVEELETILPEEIISDFYFKLNANEQLEFLEHMLETKSENETEEDIYKMVAYLKQTSKKEEKTYLYEYLNIWS